MNPIIPSLQSFSVLRFTLVEKACGTAIQAREILGYFNDVELAFEMAKNAAWKALCVHARTPLSAKEGESLELIVEDTEWGYDLRCNGRVVDRLWIHDCNAKYFLINFISYYLATFKVSVLKESLTPEQIFLPE